MLNIIMQNTDPRDYAKRFVNQIALSNFESVFEFPDSAGTFISTGEAAHDQFTSTVDGDAVIATYDDFIINADHIVTTSNRCKGLYLNILGDLKVDGTLSMTARGANVAGKYVVIDTLTGVIYYFPTEAAYSSQPTFVGDRARFDTISAIGGLGRVNAVGNVGVNGACGAGGGLTGRGGTGSSFSGGSGAGGSGQANNAGARNTNATIQAVKADTGAAGNGVAGTYAPASGGGGAGNPGGTSPAGAVRAGTNGTGGLMILFVHGEIIFGENGSIQSHGSVGGSGGAQGVGPYTHWGQSGCGSGGGSLHVFHQNPIAAPEKITATGGSAGESGNRGRNGGDGTVVIKEF